MRMFRKIWRVFRFSAEWGTIYCLFSVFVFKVDYKEILTSAMNIFKKAYQPKMIDFVCLYYVLSIIASLIYVIIDHVSYYDYRNKQKSNGYICSISDYLEEIIQYYLWAPFFGIKWVLGYLEERSRLDSEWREFERSRMIEAILSSALWWILTCAMILIVTSDKENFLFNAIYVTPKETIMNSVIVFFAISVALHLGKYILLKINIKRLKKLRP